MGTFFRAFRAFIKKNRLILDGESVVAGLSGGVDSMVMGNLLLQLQQEFPFSLTIAHVNYQLRGKESEDQEQLVAAFTAQYALPYFATRAPSLKERKQNFQQAAREFRYHYFAEVAAKCGASKVAVAHHLEDQVETVMAQWLRGASLHGLKGMRLARPLISSMVPEAAPKVTLIRPLFAFSKEQLVAYAHRHSISFIEDSSNALPLYWRNQLRQELLPLLKKLRPQAFQKIVRFGGDMSEMADYLSEEALRWLEDYGKRKPESYWIPRPRFLSLPGLLRLEIFRQVILGLKGTGQNLKRDHLLRCDQISARASGERGEYRLPGGVQFSRKRDDLLFIC